MILNLIILLILFILFITYQGFKILFSTKDTLFKNIVKLFALLGATFIFVNICLSLYIYYSLMNSKGLRGPTGIQGLNGKKGNKGLCTSNCGQQVCYDLISTNINKYLKGQNLNELKNKLLKDKINKICFSDKYLGFLHSENPNKPNEKELINYIETIFKKWIDKILKYNKGKSFLNSIESTESYFGPINIESNPFYEIKKYEIWDWGEPYKFNPIIRHQNIKEQDLPEVVGDLEVIFTNDYEEPIIINKVIKDKYGPKDCKHNQLGDNNTNPRNISKCLTDTVNPIEIWKRIEYVDYKNNISFYNISEKYTNNLNKTNTNKFYKVGTIWRGGTNNTDKLKKKSILVKDRGTDNLKEPQRFELIWSTEKFTKELNITKTDPDYKLTPNIYIYRPIPPDGYISLGDYVSNKNENNIKDELQNFRCIKKSLVEPFDLDKNTIWDETGFKIIERDQQKSEPYTITLKPVNISPIGISNKEDEINNLGHKKINGMKLGGYNFFRASESPSHSPSKEKCWIIKPSTYNVVKTNDPDVPNNEFGIGWLGGKLRESKYSVYKSDLNLDFTPKGIIEPYEDAFDTKYFIEYNDKTKTYLILRKKNSNFEYLNNNTIEFVSEDNNNNSNYQWIINTINNIEDKYYLITIQPKENQTKYLDNNNTLQPSPYKWKLYPSTSYSDLEPTEEEEEQEEEEFNS